MKYLFIILCACLSGGIGADPLFDLEGRVDKFPDNDPVSPAFSTKLDASLADMEWNPKLDAAESTAWNGFSNNPGTMSTIFCWNPISGSITSGCWLSLCGGSGCVHSACLGSGCQASGCGGSWCLVSGCIGTWCIASGCAESHCMQSNCTDSHCQVSGCEQSNCYDSHCPGCPEHKKPKDKKGQRRGGLLQMDHWSSWLY